MVPRENYNAALENYERMKRMLRRYVGEHAGRYSPPGCTCAWCTEAEPFLDDE